jgi:hypothetical protein
MVFTIGRNKPIGMDITLEGGTGAMVKRIKFSVALLLVVMVVIPMAVATGDEKTKTYRVSYSGKMVVDKPIDIGRDLKGVKLESIYFSKNEALVIVWNRTPSRVKAHVAIALFNDKNRLIAAGAESSKPIGIRSGKQANYKFKFKNFVSSFKGVSRFHLAFVVVK